MGGLDFSNLFVNLGDGTFGSLAEAEAEGAAVIKYGLFINNVLDFLIVAFVIFMVIKGMNSMKRKQEEAPPAAPPEPSDEVKLLTEIRDALNKS
jgi:large conductance mechanosensitive channel